MIRVLLADDEPIILRGLKKLLQWESLGMLIIGEAHNGDQAEQIVLNLEPEILISDICMPGKTGIDILKTIKKNNLSTKVIFLSGYQEFSYARDAVVYGAVDYVLKPVDKKQLEDTVRKAVEMITRENEEASIRNKLNNYETLDKSRHISRLVDAGIEAKDFMEPNPFFGVEPKYDYYSVLCIEIDELQARLKEISGNEEKLIKFAVFNVIDQVLNQNKCGIAFYKGNNICSVINHEDRDGVSVITLSRQLKDMVSSSLNKNITIGIGEVVKGMNHIPESYQASLENLKHEMSLEKDTTIQRVKDYIEKNYSENITLETAAGVACMNAYYFSSFFKKQAGENFKDYLTGIRMGKARKILMTTDCKTYEIAEKVGFNDPKHFSETFKKYYGKNPMEYKRDKKI